MDQIKHLDRRIEDPKVMSDADLISGMAPIIAKSRMTRPEVNFEERLELARHIVRGLHNAGIECELRNGLSVH